MKRPLIRAFLWGLASALALPPVHLLPALLFSIPAFLHLIGEAQSRRQLALIAWMFGFGLNLAGLYWITEPILTEVQIFWWLVPLAAPALAFAVAFYSIIPAFAASVAAPGFSRLLVFSGAWVVSDLLRQFAFSGFPWNLWGTDWTIPGTIGDIFIQPAALIGVHGLTLLTIFIAGLPVLGRRGLGFAAALLIAWTGFGIARLHRPVHPTGITLALHEPSRNSSTSWNGAKAPSGGSRGLASPAPRASVARQANTAARPRTFAIPLAPTRPTTQLIEQNVASALDLPHCGEVSTHC